MVGVCVLNVLKSSKKVGIRCAWSAEPDPLQLPSLSQGLFVAVFDYTAICREFQSNFALCGAFRLNYVPEVVIIDRDQS